MPIDFESLSVAITEIEKLARHQNDTYCKTVFRRIRKNDHLGLVRFTRNPTPTDFEACCVILDGMERSDLSNHAKIEKASGEKRLLKLAETVMDLIAGIPMLGHPKLGIDVRVYPRSDSHQIRARIFIDGVETHPTPLTLTALISKLRDQFERLAKIEPSGPLAPWLVNATTVRASSAAEAYVKCAILTQSRMLEGDIDRQHHPSVSKIASYDEYRSDLKRLADAMTA